MDLVELGARSMDLVDLEFLELGYLAGKKWSGAILLIWSCLEPSQTRLNNYHTTIISYRVCTHMPILKIRVHGRWSLPSFGCMSAHPSIDYSKKPCMLVT
jgi:hypothetical protein